MFGRSGAPTAGRAGATSYARGGRAPQLRGSGLAAPVLVGAAWPFVKVAGALAEGFPAEDNACFHFRANA